MANLIKQNGGAALTLATPAPGTKAVEVRRGMLQITAVADALNPVEKHIFVASTKTQICEIPDSELVGKVGRLFRFIALDIGYNIPAAGDWQYIQTRLLEYLKKYYSQMTLTDVKMAFELATTGELDEYLPRDGQGNPDHKHYQQFNAEYLAKILNAYRRRQNAVISKANKALPKHNGGLTPEQEKYYREQNAETMRSAFDEYKKTHVLNLSIVSEKLCFDLLQKNGMVEQPKETEEDRARAYSIFMREFAMGRVNKFDAMSVKRKGNDSNELDYTAYILARRKEIERAFDKMIAENIGIDKLLKK